MVADVLVELKNIDKTFSYAIPNVFLIKIGMRVLVPFGKKDLEGFVINIHNKNNGKYELKNIISVIDEKPILNEELLKLGKYISKKTITNLINCYQTMLPTALKVHYGKTINKKYITYIKLNMSYNEALKLCKNDKQKKIIEQLDNPKSKQSLSKISVSSLNNLIKKEIVLEYQEEIYRLNDNTIKEQNKIILSEEQKKTINEISSDFNHFQPFLLYGVTGSGKTEVYINLINQTINNNKTAIVLVPEISLTPQLVYNFKKIFGNKIALLHSGLSQGEKYDEWRKINEKKATIVIGARSAIFAPLENIGIIIIDEEHSNTYKQENSPKYNAIDVALFRAKYHNCPLVLGSATPSIESYTRSKLGIYKLCTMTRRINNNLPKVHLIDMKQEIRQGNRIISNLLKIKIDEKIKNNEQIILLLNRRGYTTITECKECGYTHKCSNCDIPLTYHKINNSYNCHYCNYSTSKLSQCPNCHSKNLGNLGMGTEKLEQYINEKFPYAKTIRMDVDTTRRKGSHEKIIRSFKEKKYNILIGTQMIAKGLDFPDVTLVGVINGDASLNIPDFRSSERTFQLLNQVAGRAGRGKLKGEVIIQGFNIDHYSIICASNHDYLKFYQDEIKIRKILKYSPYFNLCLIKVKGNNYDECYNEGNKIVEYLRKNELKDVIILGPSSATNPKINNIYNVQIIIKFKKLTSLYEHLIFINNHYLNKKIKVDIDIDPIKF